MGRPKIHIDVKEVERLAGLGLTEEQIARSLGIHYTTLLDRKKNYSEFSEALATGRTRAIVQVSNALYDRAIEGDIAAIKYWKNNMEPERWRDKWDINHTGEFSHEIIVVDTGCGYAGRYPEDEEDSN